MEDLLSPCHGSEAARGSFLCIIPSCLCHSVEAGVSVPICQVT